MEEPKARRNLIPDSLAIVGLGRQQELKAEIADEIRLIAARWFEASSGHEQEDDGAVNFVARAEINRRLEFRGMEGALGIELRVEFKFFRELVADDQACEPAVRSFVDGLITDFV